MTMPDRIISVATARGQVFSIKAQLNELQQRKAAVALGHLVQVGQVAAFSLRDPEAATDWPQVTAWLGQRLGEIVVDAVTRSEAAPFDPPAYLIPVWPFDHAIEGHPASTGMFLGSDLDIRARRCDDEERGTRLPGWTGLWSIHAQPF